MGGLRSGNRYRFDKKTTTDECHAIDLRYLHRNGLLSPGRGFSLSWSRAGRETGSIRAVVYRDRIVLSYSRRGGPGGEWENVEEPVSLEWTPCNFGGRAALVRLSRSSERCCVRPEGGHPVRAGEVFPVPLLLRLALREQVR